MVTNWILLFTMVQFGHDPTLPFVQYEVKLERAWLKEYRHHVRDAADPKNPQFKEFHLERAGSCLLGLKKLCPHTPLGRFLRVGTFTTR